MQEKRGKRATAQMGIAPLTGDQFLVPTLEHGLRYDTEAGMFSAETTCSHVNGFRVRQAL